MMLMTIIIYIKISSNLFIIIITLLLIPATKYPFIVANVNTAPLVSLSAIRSTLFVLLST